MRKNPWHLRTPSTEHYQWFRNLVDLHRITESWRAESAVSTLTNRTTPSLGRKIKETLWMLDELLNKTIEDYMDDTLPQDMLGRLDQAVWTVQAETLSTLLGKTNSPETEILSKTGEELLRQNAWKLGKSCVETRWRPLINRGGQAPLREVLLALQDTPFSGYPNGDGFLVKRAVPTQIEIELRSCPHYSQYAEVHSVADSLCLLHTHWMTGFASALNEKIKVEHLQESRRCLQRWYLA